MQPSNPGPGAKAFAFARRYGAVALVFAALAVIMALGWTGWTPTSATEWLVIAGVTPAGGGGALLGDRLGLWLRERGYGRQ
jgi:hypothetical protein